MTDQREDFEEAAARMGCSLRMTGSEIGEYHHSATQDAWGMWQECCDKAAREQDESYPDCDTCKATLNYMPWHYSQGEQRHLHACDDCWKARESEGGDAVAISHHIMTIKRMKNYMDRLRSESDDIGHIVDLDTDMDSLDEIERLLGKGYSATPHPAPLVPDPDIQTIQERDYWEEKATEIAEDVGKYLRIEVGEHSSANCPMQNAIDAVYNATPQPVNGWIKCSEKMPKLGQRVILKSQGVVQHFMPTLDDGEEGPFWDFEQDYNPEVNFGWDCWMPVPTPPEQGAE